MTVLEEMNAVFQALFFGSGSWLGLILLISLFLALMVKWKYSSALFIPVAIFLGLDYLTHDLGWHAMIMFMTSIFMLIFMVKDVKS